MSRLAELEARRALLLARCAAQRAELAQRLAQLRTSPAAALFGATTAAGAGRAARHPLAWVAALAGLALMGRTRQVLTLLAWVRTGLSVAARAAQLLGLLGALRERRAARPRRRAGATP